MREVVIGIGLLALAAGGGLKDVTVSAPEHDPVSGRIIYTTICIRCHGIGLFKSVHDGRANTAMGAWREALTDDEIWDVLAYVRTLAPRE
jgi:mono/diheme cytochrome c family protein